MRFRRKKGQEDEVVSGDVEPESADSSSWTVPADAGVIEDAQGDTVDMAAVQPATAAGGAARSEGDEEPADAHAEVEEPAAVAVDEVEAAEKARADAEEAAKAQREIDEKAREQAERARDERAAAEARTSVSGASVTSPGLGSDASPGAAAAANARERERPAAPDRPDATPAVDGPLAPILSSPAVQKKPELLVIGGLAAGFVVARFLKAISSDDS